MITAKIYRIYDDDHEYIGSTVKTLSQRLQKHKSSCKEHKKRNFKLYKYVNNQLDGKWDQLEMDVIEEVKVDSIKELRRLEGEYIQKYEPNLNERIAGRTKSEYQKYYYEKNKEARKQYQREYYISSKRSSASVLKNADAFSKADDNQHKPKKGKHIEEQPLQIINVNEKTNVTLKKPNLILIV